MFCSKCGNRLSADDDFCPVCGARVSHSQDLPQTDKFIPNPTRRRQQRTDEFADTAPLPDTSFEDEDLSDAIFEDEDDLRKFHQSASPGQPKERQYKPRHNNNYDNRNYSNDYTPADNGRYYRENEPKKGKKNKTALIVTIIICILLIILSIVIIALAAAASKKNENKIDKAEISQSTTSQTTLVSSSETTQAKAETTTKKAVPPSLSTPKLAKFKDVTQKGGVTAAKATWAAVKGASGFEVKETFLYKGEEFDENTTDTKDCYFEESSAKWMYVKINVRAYRVYEGEKIYSPWSDYVECTLNGEDGDKNPIYKVVEETTAAPAQVLPVDDYSGIIKKDCEGYTSDYVVKNGEPKWQEKVRKGWHIIAKNYANNYDIDWYECWTTDGKYYGWIDSNYLDFDFDTPQDINASYTVTEDEVFGYSDDYVYDYGEKEKIAEFSKGETVYVTFFVHTHGVDWYRCVDNEGTLIGWVNSKYLQ